MSNLGNKQIMAKNILFYMDQKGIDRMDICDALGIKYTTFVDWINAKTYPRIDKIELMANYFGIDKSDLIEDKDPIPEDLIILNRAAKKMNPEKRKKLIEMAKVMFAEDFSKDE